MSYTEEEIGSFNFEEHKKPVSVAELNKACEDMFNIRAIIEEKEKELSGLSEQLEVIKRKVQGILADSGLDSFKSPFGTVGTRTINTFTMPKDPDKKRFFLQFLDAQGMSEGMLTVNHQTLNAYCRSLLEENKHDLNYSIPGVDEPKAYTTITMRKG